MFFVLFISFLCFSDIKERLQSVCQSKRHKTKLKSNQPSAVSALIAQFALHSARSAFFIIDLSTFHNLLVEVGSHWLQHCMLCLNLPLAGLCVSDLDMWSCFCCIFLLFLAECLGNVFYVFNTLWGRDKMKAADTAQVELAVRRDHEL